MEEELKCPQCRHFLRQPVLLPCGHSYCRDCVLLLKQQRRNEGLLLPSLPPLPQPNLCSSASDTLSLAPSCCDEGDHSSAPDDKLDKLSLLSDSADSGFGGGVFRAVAWCENPLGALPSKFHCGTCGYFYCEDCQAALHPPRGPLKFHQLVPSEQFRRFKSSQFDLSSPSASTSLINSQYSSPSSLAKCSLHAEQELNLYCSLCKQAICNVCTNGMRHSGHPVQPIHLAAKAHKAGF
uniref:Uncharacterized protein n=1 Tax=Meloidogyne javanica TaxID=6303 RepID=A0A915LXY3_MELJA